MKPLIRLFFRTLRILLGPVMLIKERLSRPTAVQRAPAQQAEVDRQCQESLTLYQFKTCPFCIKVRQEMRRLALPITRLDAQHEALNRAALLQGSGATKVPCLKITEASGSVRWLNDSGAIVDYLRGRFSTAPA
ncbi:glutathione S-transferase N-terminal domain-containing protein [soil metagenome]